MTMTEQEITELVEQLKTREVKIYERDKKGCLKLARTARMDYDAADQIIAILMQVLSNMPDYAGPQRNTPGGQVRNFKNIQKEIEETKAHIALNLIAPFDDFMAHVESGFSEGPLKWLDERINSWGSSTDRWINQIAIPAWDRFSGLFQSEVGPQLEQTETEVEKLVKEFGDDTGLSGALDKLMNMKPEDAIKGIGNAIHFVNEKLEELAENKDWQQLVENLASMTTNLFSEGNIQKMEAGIGKEMKELAAWAHAIDLMAQGKYGEAISSLAKYEFGPQGLGTGSGTAVANLGTQANQSDMNWRAVEDIAKQNNALLGNTDELKKLNDHLSLTTSSGFDWLPGILPSGGIGGSGAGSGGNRAGSGNWRTGGSHIPYRPGATPSLGGAGGGRLSGEGDPRWMPNDQGYRVTEEYDWEGSSSQYGPLGNRINVGEIGVGQQLAAKYNIHFGDWVKLKSGGWRQVTESSAKDWAIEYHANKQGQFESIAGRDSILEVSRKDPRNAVEAAVTAKDSGKSTGGISSKAMLQMENLKWDAIDVGTKAMGGETEAEKTEKSLKNKGNLRSTTSHPIVINNTVHVHAAEGQSETAIADAVNKHLESKTPEHAERVLQHIKDKRENYAA
jgi:hypothetical protein